MSTKIELTYQHEYQAEKHERKIVVPVDAIAIEDWCGTDRKTPVPNLCRVTYGGQTYKVLMSRLDLEKEIEGLGTKIHRTKPV